MRNDPATQASNLVHVADAIGVDQTQLSVGPLPYLGWFYEGSSAAITNVGVPPADCDDTASCSDPEPTCEPTAIVDPSGAQQAAELIMVELGVSADAITWTSDGDSCRTRVGARFDLPGAGPFGTGLVGYSFTFDGANALAQASGPVALPEIEATYPLISIDAAVARMAWYPLARQRRSSVETVTLTSVQPDLLMSNPGNGDTRFLPAYTFTGDDGELYSVPAVADDALDLEPSTDSSPVTTVPLIRTQPAAPNGRPPAELTSAVGLSLSAFQAVAESSGYTVRVVVVDGVEQERDADFRADRVNVAVDTASGSPSDPTVIAITEVG